MVSVLAVCFLLLPATAAGLQLRLRECAFTDQPQGTEPLSTPFNELRGEVQENGTVRCIHGSRCYGLWEKRPDGEVHLVKQGCWTHIGSQQECHGSRCLVTATPSQVQNGSYRFCCCSRDLCNTAYSEAPPPDLRPLRTDGRVGGQTDQQLLRRGEAVLIALAFIAIAAIIVVALFLGYRMMRGKQKHSLWAQDQMETGNTAVDLDHLKLLELIGRGRYGTVFRGSLNERCVAVKLFTSANRQNFANERSIYRLPLLKQHDNIARFLATDERTAADGRAEFLILMEYYPHGCLSSYLSVHTVDWSTCCRLTHGVTRGLAFLHSELSRAGQCKPGVAHRDVSSRNVLLRSDLSCVLADFGLSMTLTGSQPPRPGDDDTMAISEVGTVRYMAPEVLGGALDLRDCAAALKQVDVYALGLLYWESFRRCSHLYTGEAVPEYQLAFQAELGHNPSFEEMQILVNRNKSRPRIPEAWRLLSPALRSLTETMEDCWDQDAEARLTAQCAEERLCELTLLHNHRIDPPPVGPASSQDLGVVQKVHGDDFAASVVRATRSGAEAAGRYYMIDGDLDDVKNKHTCISLTASGGAVPRVCPQLTEEDLETLDPEQVNSSVLALQGELGGVGSSSIHPLPKQQNLPQRPTSLQLQNNDPASCRLKLGKLRSNLRQVETGVAKMNTVTVATATEPHQVTTGTKTSVATGYSAGVPVLVMNSVVLTEDEENRTNLLNPSPDEHAPLLRREPELHKASETTSRPNSNNNNNRIQLADLKGLGPCVQRALCAGPVLEPRNRDSDRGSAPGATSSSEARSSAAQNLDPYQGAPEPAAFGSLEDLESTEAPALEPADLRERPRSLDLSSTGVLSDSSLKIKRRVKTPYILKKWRPASWVVPSDATFYSEFSRQRAGSVSRIRPSRFTTSDPNTCF
ncbi:bone morphogenetic protein receptor type-2-like [Eleginops maclovinus]